MRPEDRAFDVFEAAAEAPAQVALLEDGEAWTYARLADAVRARQPALSAGGALDARLVLVEAAVSRASIVDVLALLAARVPMVMLHPRLTAEEKDRIAARVGPAPRLSPDGDVRGSPAGANEPATSSAGAPSRVAADLEGPRPSPTGTGPSEEAAPPLDAGSGSGTSDPPRALSPPDRAGGAARAAGAAAPSGRGGASGPSDAPGAAGLDRGGPPPSRDAGGVGSDLRGAAVVFFTSGSAGAPKGVLLSRAALFAATEASASNLGWRDDDRWLMSIPAAHVGGFSVLLRCLAARRAVVLGAPSPEGFVQAVLRDRATLASLVPTQLVRLLRDRPRLRPPARLRAVLLGGAAAPPALVAEARAAGYPVLTTYGLTEACAQVATEAPGAPAPQGSVGRPLVPGSVRVREGRIWLRTPALLSGYLGEAASPVDAQGWFDSGDLGRLDAEGFLFVRGRAGDLIVTGGENVHPAEVEAAIRAWPDVEDVVVFGRPDPEWGAVVCAAVVPAEGAELTAAALETAARAQLAGFKRPRRWAIVPALPTNRTGKVDRRAAAARFAGLLEGVPGPPPDRRPGNDLDSTGHAS